jgi:hypothetical protein
MTGSSYLPIVVPVVAFLAMGFWLAVIFYADSHPGHGRKRPADEVRETGTESGQLSGAPGHERTGISTLTGHDRAA